MHQLPCRDHINGINTPTSAQNKLLGTILLHATPERVWIFSVEFITGDDSVRECPTGVGPTPYDNS